MGKEEPMVVSLLPEGENLLEDVRLNIAEITYGFSSGPAGSFAELIFRNSAGRTVLRVTMPEDQLDSRVSHAIYLNATNQ